MKRILILFTTLYFLISMTPPKNDRITGGGSSGSDSIKNEKIYDTSLDSGHIKCVDLRLLQDRDTSIVPGKVRLNTVGIMQGKKEDTTIKKIENRL